MTTFEQAAAELKDATANLASARKDLAHHRSLAKFALPNALMAAASREHVAYHRAERALAAYDALRPAAHVAKAAPPVPTVPAIAPRDPGAEAVANYWRR